MKNRIGSPSLKPAIRRKSSERNTLTMKNRLEMLTEYCICFFFPFLFDFTSRNGLILILGPRAFIAFIEIDGIGYCRFLTTFVQNMVIDIFFASVHLPNERSPPQQKVLLLCLQKLLLLIVSFRTFGPFLSCIWRLVRLTMDLNSSLIERIKFSFLPNFKIKR